MTLTNGLSYMKGAIDEPLLEETIGTRITHTVAAFPDELALVVEHQSIRWTYSEFKKKIDQLSISLLELGVKKGDRVGIWAPNCAEWSIVQFATAQIGAILVCINPAYRTYELEFALNKVECSMLIAAENFKTSDYIAMLNELAPELKNAPPGQLKSEKLPHLHTVISIGENHHNGMYRFDEIMKLSCKNSDARLDEISASLKPKDAINIQFTSGTTGMPKGATLSHHNILNNARTVSDSMGLAPGEKLCIPVPLYHCFGMVAGSLACMSSGAAAVYPALAFDPISTLAVVSKEKCTALHGVPTMFIGMLAEAANGDYDLSSLRTGIMAGAPCPEEIMKRVMSQMNMTQILIAYGQTETSPINHITSVDDTVEIRVSTVGKACAHVENKIIGPDGKTLPVGEQGEVCSRGYLVMAGYWNDEQQTRDTIDDDGWLHSGDLGIMDGNGYVKITGRIKDMIIRGGENIYPREIEEFLFQHSAIKDAQVFGIPDEKFGEIVCAWIILNDNETMNEDSLKAYCRDKITHYKIPKHVRFVDEFPSTVTGKPQKFVMRDMMQAEG